MESQFALILKSIRDFEWRVYILTKQLNSEIDMD